MTVRLSAIVSVLALVVGIGGCPCPIGAVCLEQRNDGDDIQAMVSQTVIITLPSKASTGYSWSIAELDTTVLQNTGQSYIAPVSPLIGAPGQERWEFTTRSAGTTTLRLEYRQPWAPAGEAPGDTFEIDVTVTAPGT